MRHTFFLRNAQRDKSTKEIISNNKTSIFFSCYFNSERKQFFYSTGERISPLEWNFDENSPFTKGKNKNPNASTIKTQLSRYSNTFESVEALCIKTGEVFTSDILRDAFDKEFKKVKKKDAFFDVFDSYVEEKKRLKHWKPATIKRYKNLKNHLKAFEVSRSYKLTFNKINKKFYTKFLDYCYNDLKHYSNTVSRNVGLFKSFMYWALENKFSYNESFKDFEKPKTVITEEVALTLKQVEEIFNLELEGKKEKVRDVFVFQCLTGMRYGEMKNINNNVITENAILLKEEKDSHKEYREIPLFGISRYILKKYDNSLPLISNQKQNEYIKEILKDIEDSVYTKTSEFTRVRGVESTKFNTPFYNRVSTHTARRTFITIMKNKGIADKTIMAITGHKDLKTFNNYHKVSDNSKLDAVKEVFGELELPKLKKA